jgi:hypothetical protein
MSFKILSALLATQQSLTEADDSAELDMGGGIGPKPHPVLSRAELVRFSDKLDQAYNKLEEIRSIFKHAPDATGPAHKLHHIGTKGGFDLSAFDDVVQKIDDLEGAINELHQSWGTQVQSDTGAFDEGDGATDHEADADDLSVEPETPPADETPDDPLAEPAAKTSTK